VVIPRIKNDLVELFTAAAHSQLQNVTLQQDDRYATTIVAVSGGYPEDYQKGMKIEGLDTIISDTILFHSGTKEVNGAIVTNGGRVLCATAMSKELEDAISKSRELIEAIEYTDKYYRRDIGFEFLDTTTEIYQDE
jgi:phosphoribosylamine---glycine ligase